MSLKDLGTNWSFLHNAFVNVIGDLQSKNKHDGSSGSTFDQDYHHLETAFEKILRSAGLLS